MKLRFSPSKAAIGYISLSVIALALFAVPLWYGWRANLGTFRAYVPGGEMQRFVEVFQRDGANALAAAVAGRAPNMPADEVLAFAGPTKELLAGNLRSWPHEVPDAPGVYGLVIGLGGEASMRVVASQVELPGGYRLLMGRESVRFESLVERFWYGIAAAMLAVLALGVAFAWLLRRSLLREVNDVSRAASAIVQGDLSGRLEVRGGSGELAALAQTVNHMLAQLEQRYALVMNASDEGFWDWNVATGAFYASPRLLEICGLPAGTTFASRDDFVVRFPFHPEDGVKWRQALDAHFAGETTRLEFEARLALGREVRWIHLIGLATRDTAGAVARLTGAMTDVTERKRAEEALRASEERYSLAMEASEEGYVDVNVDTGEFVTSERLNEIFGIAPGTRFRGRNDFLKHFRFYAKDGETYLQALRAVEADGGPDRYQFEFRIVLPSGEVRWIWTRGKVTRDAEARARRRVGVFADITARKRAEQALRLSEERYAHAMEGSDAGHWDWNIVTDEMFISERAREMLALPAGPLPARRVEIMERVPMHPDDRASMNEKVAASIRSGIHERDYRVIPGPDEVRWLRSRAKIYRDAQGAAVRMTGSLVDITERKLAVVALRASEERYSLAMEASAEGHFDWNVRTDEIFVSAHIKKVFGIPLDAEFRTRNDLIACIPYHPQDAAWLVTMARDTLAGSALAHEFEYRIVPGGEVHWLQARWKIFRDGSGAALRVIGVVTDITDRKRAADELRASEARFRALTELSSDWYWRQDEELRFTYISHQVAHDGYPLEWIIGKRRWELPGVTPIFSAWAEHQAVLAARKPFREFEYTRTGQDGRTHSVSVSGAPIFDEQGNFRGYQGVGRNITERKRAEQELKAMEGKLRQAQRLEAMGTLAGGIAHDFNNILGAILGFGEMALRDAPKNSRLHRDVESIITAGERGRALVDRVLAFSRSGVAERSAVHVEQVIREALDLISAKLPPSVTLHARLRAGTAAMLGDATQVHQVLMNLATNAVQAMPDGGTLGVSLDAVRIDTPHVPTIGTLAKGDYIVLQVADNGTGIAPDIVERIFDPFFTTKEVGTGTGLGLSLVHGIVTEVGGAINVASTPGAGSTLTVYLPRSGDAQEQQDREQVAMPRGGGQRVLIVDDEEPLVTLATRTLSELGYAPVGFTSSSQALAAFRADPACFDAVIADERMPGMSGSALIREMRGISDRIPIVLMSGHVSAALATRARNAGAEEILKKPLSARDLAASLARVLGS